MTLLQMVQAPSPRGLINCNFGEMGVSANSYKVRVHPMTVNLPLQNFYCMTSSDRVEEVSPELSRPFCMELAYISE